MAIYDHQCQSEECKFEWEDSYSINADPPKICPKCGKETAKRMISLGGKGVVLLNDKEFAEANRNAGKQLAKDAMKSENTYSNLLGPDKYHTLQKEIDRRKRER